MRNLELKVQVDDLGAVRRQATALGASPKGTTADLDTYFKADLGRLKLRQTFGLDTATLIAYRRPDEPSSRYSDYRLLPVARPELLRDALALALGVLVEVRKERELWLYGATRIHLDRVAGLGSFVELETLLGEQSEAWALDEHRRVRDRLGLAGLPAVAGSYADLLLAAEDTSGGA